MADSQSHSHLERPDPQNQASRAATRKSRRSQPIRTFFAYHLKRLRLRSRDFPTHHPGLSEMAFYGRFLGVSGICAAAALLGLRERDFTNPITIIPDLRLLLTLKGHCIEKLLEISGSGFSSSFFSRDDQNAFDMLREVFPSAGLRRFEQFLQGSDYVVAVFHSFGLQDSPP